MRKCAFRGLVWACLFAAYSTKAAETKLKSDEKIVFYPSVAQRVAGETNLWRAEIRGCVFEPEKWRVTVAALREALDLKGVKMTAEEEKLFGARARLFLVDHERGKKVFVRFGTNEVSAGKSGADGRFGAKVLLHEADSETGAPFTAALTPGDTRKFTGEGVPAGRRGSQRHFGY